MGLGPNGKRTFYTKGRSTQKTFYTKGRSTQGRSTQKTFYTKDVLHRRRSSQGQVPIVAGVARRRDFPTQETLHTTLRKAALKVKRKGRDGLVNARDEMERAGKV